MKNLREQYRTILINLEKNCDIASRQWAETGDAGYLISYEHYKNEMIRIKEMIIESERQGELNV
tara:strand:- start:906 stop:1097 length:192 start_codon:yes stop_codon:yes gene_type:complete